MDIFRNGLFYSPDDGGANGDGNGDPKGNSDGNSDGDGQEALGWDTFHASLAPEAQKLIADRESGLKSALSNERDARKEAEKNLRDVAADLEKGSEAQKSVLKLADDLAVQTAKADFYEDAHAANVTNLKLAYHIATTEGFISDRGRVDFDGMKKEYPELFAKKFVPEGGAGDGTGTRPPGKSLTMNDLIRAKAGR